MTQEIRDLYTRYLNAMVDSDTATLRDITTDDYFLQHITGYKQPGEEWFREIDEKQFIYFSYQLIGEPTIAVGGDTAVLHHTIITDARVYGSRNDWRLNFTIKFVKQDGTWKIAENVARS